MTERGLPLADGATACPFVAFEDDRDERSSVPDHRHRCYAEQRPAPRALAHQEAYCLSAAFPVCPTFQDWARREAARSRGDSGGRGPSGPTEDQLPAAAAMNAAAAAAAETAARASQATGEDLDASRGDPDAMPGAAAAPGVTVPGAAAAAAGAAAAGAAGRAFADPGPADPGPADPDADDLWSAGDRSSRSDEPVQRNPPRDWAAPPPWLASAEGRPVGDDSDPPSFLSHRSEPGAGLAGSAADQLAGGPPPPRRPESGQDPWAVGGAAVAGAMGAAAGGAADPRSDTGGYGSGAGGSIPAGGGRDEFAIEEGQPNRIPRRPRAYDQHLGGPADAPDWERPRRYEAYPTIKTRVGMPGIPQVPRLALTAGVVAILALALFFLPGLLNLGGSGSPSAPSASPSARPSQSVAPTPLPAPTPQVYTIKKGDTLSKIAKANGLTLQDLLDANPDIKNPNKVAEGQQIVIPAPGDSEPADAAGSPEGSAP